MKDRECVMGIEGSNDMADRSQVAINELGQAVVVVHSAAAGATADVQLKTRDAEGVLHIDQQQADLEVILSCRLQLMLLCPGTRLESALLVRHLPDGAHAVRIEVRW